MSKTSEIIFYYRRTDTQTYNNLFFAPLFSDLQFNNIIGQINSANNIVQYNEGIELNTFDSKITYFYLDNNETNKKDSITASLTTYNASAKQILNPGFFLFQIIAGEGKYQGASGTIYLYIDENFIRYFKIIVNY